MLELNRLLLVGSSALDVDVDKDLLDSIDGEPPGKELDRELTEKLDDVGTSVVVDELVTTPGDSD